jgi:Glutathione S-transferase, N-terminal domain
MILIGQYDLPYARRVAVSLRLLGFAYEHDTRPVFADFDAMRRINALARIPSLVRDDGETLIDSAAILDWGRADRRTVSGKSQMGQNRRWDLGPAMWRDRASIMDAGLQGIHDQCMDGSYISALSALGGSLVGGLTSSIATLLSVRTQARTGQRAQDKSLRADLYRDFIIAASKVRTDAHLSHEPNIPDMIALYALVSRMRLLSSPRVVACAEKLMLATYDTYFGPDRTIAELYELIKSGKGHDAGLDSMKEFSEVAREELQTL